MYRFAILLLLAMLALATCAGAVTWDTIVGPADEGSGDYNHIGTDGVSLYAVFQNNEFWKYSFSQDTPTAGTWTQLADPPRTVCDWDSYSDIAFQSGYLYTSAIPSGIGGRTIIRYKIATNTWELWQSGGVDINASNSSGNAMFLDPTITGTGYSAWHAGGAWVAFNWGAKTTDNGWWGNGPGSAMSRNEDIATNGNGTYYAAGNDQTDGFSSGDIIYTWNNIAKGTPSSLLAQKPWQAGFGQSIEFIPGVNSPSSHDEIWMIRGADGSGSSFEGWGSPTMDWARIDLTSLGAGWSTDTLPGDVGYNGEIVRIDKAVFVRGEGAEWYVTKLGTAPPPPVGIPPGDAKKLADGSTVDVSGIVTAIFPSQFYIENGTRSSGIQIRYSGAPALNQSVVVHGTIQTDSTTHELYVQASTWQQSGTGKIIRPLVMNSRLLGGGAYGQQSGVYKGVGLNNIGLLVKMFAKVTFVATDKSYIYVSDGSDADDGSGNLGVKVDISTVASSTRSAILVGDKVTVTGISGIYPLNDDYHRMIKVRSGSDFSNTSDDGNRPIVKKVMVINFDPIIESKGNKRLHEVYWPTHDPKTVLTPGYNNDLNECSKGYITYQVVEWVDADYFPIKIDGFQYTDATFTNAWEVTRSFHSPDGVDYVKVLTDKYYSYNNPRTVAERVAAGDVDEVYMFGAPYFGYWEAAMAGPSPFYINGGTYYLPSAGRNFPIMGFNYERYIGEMLEDYGHRSESTMSRVYGGWIGGADRNNWEKFTAYEKVAPGKSACGSVHYSPNSVSDYDWGNSTYVWSTCDDWLNNWPNLTGTKRLVNKSEWGNGDIRLHHKWWFRHFPSKPGVNPDGKQNNWWKYLADFNGYPESR